VAVSLLVAGVLRVPAFMEWQSIGNELWNKIRSSAALYLCPWSQASLAPTMHPIFGKKRREKGRRKKGCKE
jgi:hypothetical protein